MYQNGVSFYEDLGLSFHRRVLKARYRFRRRPGISGALLFYSAGHAKLPALARKPPKTRATIDKRRQQPAWLPFLPPHVSAHIL